ncbi:hypothetical protein L226DRAFT_533920 [Lentinus tigrinus ALCF2SS1-7]|uniref:uncharacterized protein n=1 Tax=Lentinus tigrinus ALCF2SS1-7 TaxID=1328758 RepID=UPI00116617EE|nr:hypothetical protein L226DRAFT_533920 [Lentinus tigrinus ALCF2SS1-7]
MIHEEKSPWGACILSVALSAAEVRPDLAGTRRWHTFSHSWLPSAPKGVGMFTQSSQLGGDIFHLRRRDATLRASYCE